MRTPSTAPYAGHQARCSLSFGGIAGLRAALLATCAAVAGECLAQTVQFVVASKQNRYLQTSASNVQVDSQSPTGAFQFSADVVGQNISGLSPAPTVAGPIDASLLGPNGGVLAYDASSNAWRLAGSYGSAAEREARFGNGTYTFTVKGNVIPLQLTGDAYPNVPTATLAGGAWVDGKYYFDPAKPLTISTNAFAGYSTYKGVIDLDYALSYVQQAWSLDPANNFRSVTIPANTFEPGREYTFLVRFNAFVDDGRNAALGSYNAAIYRSETAIRVKAERPQPFPMTVTSSIGPTVASASAVIQYRPQDVGSTGSVYVFALAPADLAKAAPAGDPPLVVGKTISANGRKDTAVSCVLAQLNASGQLQAVSVSSLQAYITGVLSSQGQAVTLLNGVPTVNIAGAVFFVGYGSSASSMINGGINRSAVAIPGTRECRPQPPQTGWWWNPAEPGRGYSIEVQGGNLFVASYLYDVSGRATWHVAMGPVSLDGSLFTNQLLTFGNGVTLGGPYKPNTRLPDAGPVTLTFDDATHGTLVWPGGTVRIERYGFGTNGITTDPLTGQPESGWWWGGSGDSGRGFFVEWQGNRAFVAGYMYDEQGNATWHVADSPVASAQTFAGSWMQFANGQTLTGAYRTPTQVNGNVAPVTIQFQGTDTAVLTLPSGPLPIARFRF